MKNKRVRIIGLLGVASALLALGTVVPASAYNPQDPNLSPCGGVPGNLIKNCSFETALGANGLVGWEHQVSQNSDNATSAAKSGSRSLRLGSSGRDDVWTQTVAVAPHTKYVVSAWVEILGATPNNHLSITASNTGTAGVSTDVYASTNQEINGFSQVGATVTTGSARTMTITIAGNNQPSQSYVDDVVVVAQPSGCAAIVNNAVKNCGFEDPTTAPWVHSVSHSSDANTVSSFGGVRSLYFGSSVADDVWYQVLTVRPHTTYTLRYSDYAVSGSSVPNNDLKVALSNVAAAGGQLKIVKTNVTNQIWKPVSRTFTTGSGSSVVLTVSGMNAPGFNRLDDFSLTVAPKLKLTVAGKKVVTTLTGLGGQQVQLQKKVGARWVRVRTFVAPKSGVAKAWALKVAKGKFRAVSTSTPGYGATTSNIVKR